jgi:hypothetical protein
MAKAAVLNIEILAAAGEAVKEFDKIKDKSASTHAALKAGALVAASAIVAGLGAATKAAMDHEESVAKLQTAYRDAGISTKDMNSSLEDIEASSRRTGQSTEDNITAYTHLVTATRDTAKAHTELATAQDLAAYKGISVSDAADAITKAAAGNTRALKDLGIATKDAGGHQLTTAALMEQLSKAVKGQADAVGDTAVGQFKRYHESLDQTKEKIGESLLPALKQLLAMLQPLFDWLDKNTAVLRILAPVLAIVAAVIFTVTAAQRAWAAIQVIVNAELWANPIGVVILALVALVAIVVVVVKHWNDVRNVINIVWQALKDAGAWIMAHWPLIVGAMFGPLGLFIGWLASSKNAVNDLLAALRAIGDAVSKAIGWLGKLPHGAGSIIGKLNPFSLEAGAGGGAAPTPPYIQINATPGDDLPEVVYRALHTYQTHHVRPELAPMFGQARRAGRQIVFGDT